MTQASAAIGTFIKVGDGGTPENFTAIAEVLTLGGLKLALNTNDATNFSSPGGWKEFIGTLLDAGEVDLTMNFIPSDATQSYAAGLLHTMVTKAKRNFQIVFSTNPAITWAFASLVSGFEVQEPIDGKLTVAAKLRVTGQPTLT